MTRDAHTTRSEATDARKPAELADAPHAEHSKPREEAVQPVRYLWPSLMSLWQAGAR